MLALLGAFGLSFLLGLHMVDGASNPTTPYDQVAILNAITMSALALWAVLGWIVLKFRGLTWWLAATGSVVLAGLFARLLVPQPEIGSSSDVDLLVFSVVPALAATAVQVGFSGWAHIVRGESEPVARAATATVLGVELRCQWAFR